MDYKMYLQYFSNNEPITGRLKVLSHQVTIDMNYNSYGYPNMSRGIMSTTIQANLETEDIDSLNSDLERMMTTCGDLRIYNNLTNNLNIITKARLTSCSYDFHQERLLCNVVWQGFNCVITTADPNTLETLQEWTPRKPIKAFKEVPEEVNWMREGF